MISTKIGGADIVGYYSNAFTIKIRNNTHLKHEINYGIKHSIVKQDEASL